MIREHLRRALAERLPLLAFRLADVGAFGAARRLYRFARRFEAPR